MSDTVLVPRAVQTDAPDRVAAWRASRRLTQEEAARIIGCSQAMYSRVEAGVAWPNEEIRKVLAKKAGIPVADWGPRPARRRRSALPATPVEPTAEV